MLTLRPSAARGHVDHGWLDSHHTFSFASYRDPAFMGFRKLRVINEDRVRPGKGFGTHPHRDMEIVSIVLSGALQHKDSLGTGSVIRPGDVQRMSAGTGITHSEWNGSATEPVHFLQIWIMPDRSGHLPSYEQRSFPEPGRRGRLCLVASPDGAEGSVTIHQDVRLFLASLAPGDAVTHTVAPGRGAWLQVTRGDVEVDGQALTAGDGASTTDAGALTIRASRDAEVLLFDLA